MKKNFSDADFELIATTLDDEFSCRWNKAGNITAERKGYPTKYVFQNSPSGMFVRRYEASRIYSGVTSVWPVFRDSKTNTYEMFDDVYALMERFCRYWLRENFR